MDTSTLAINLFPAAYETCCLLSHLLMYFHFQEKILLGKFLVEDCVSIICKTGMKTFVNTVKPVLSSHSKRTLKLVFKYCLSLNADQKYCRMLHGQNAPMDHSAIL